MNTKNTNNTNTNGNTNGDKVKALITPDNIVMLSERIAEKVVLFCMARGYGLSVKGLNAAEVRHLVQKKKPNDGNSQYLQEVYNSLVWDICRRKGTNGGLYVSKVTRFVRGNKVEVEVPLMWKTCADGRFCGYDIVQEVGLYLNQEIVQKVDGKIFFVEKYLTDENSIGEKRQDGTPCDIYYTACHIAKRYINRMKKENENTVFVYDYDALDGSVLPIPEKWDTFTDYEYKTIIAIIKDMNLTEGQQKFLNLRFQGYSHTQIAEKMGVTENAVKLYQNRIRERVEKLAAKNPDLAAALKKWRGK